MKRILLFVATNFAVLMVISLVFKLLGFEGLLQGGSSGPVPVSELQDRRRCGRRRLRRARGGGAAQPGPVPRERGRRASGFAPGRWRTRAAQVGAADLQVSGPCPCAAKSLCPQTCATHSSCHLCAVDTRWLTSGQCRTQWTQSEERGKTGGRQACQRKKGCFLTFFPLEQHAQQLEGS